MPTGVSDEAPISAWYAFARHPADCDTNGIPDVCDPDCNKNRIPDSCELALLRSSDCNGDGTPDECQAPIDYSIPVVSSSGGLHGASNDEFDFIWLTRFTVTTGNEIVTHIAIPWTLGMPDGYPATLLVYSDPNSDGQPHDALLLTTLEVTGFDDFGLQLPLSYTIYPIDPTDVGEAGEHFFIGCYVQCTVGVLPAVALNFGGPVGQSWRALNTLGQGNIENLAANQSLVAANADYMIRALALDCNGNGAWDQCDIDSGFSQDSNNDGIPYECQPTCALADATGNGVIDVDDLLTVINSWGACDPPPSECNGDVTGNGVVDVDDLLMVVNNWGPCV